MSVLNRFRCDRGSTGTEQVGWPTGFVVALVTVGAVATATVGPQIPDAVRDAIAGQSAAAGSVAPADPAPAAGRQADQPGAGVDPGSGTNPGPGVDPAAAGAASSGPQAVRAAPGSIGGEPASEDTLIAQTPENPLIGPPSESPAATPSESDALAQLTDLGFSQATVRNLLQQYGVDRPSEALRLHLQVPITAPFEMIVVPGTDVYEVTYATRTPTPQETERLDRANTVVALSLAAAGVSLGKLGLTLRNPRHWGKIMAEAGAAGIAAGNLHIRIQDYIDLHQRVYGTQRLRFCWDAGLCDGHSFGAGGSPVSFLPQAGSAEVIVASAGGSIPVPSAGSGTFTIPEATFEDFGGQSTLDLFDSLDRGEVTFGWAEADLGLPGGATGTFTPTPGTDTPALDTLTFDSPALDTLTFDSPALDTFAFDTFAFDTFAFDTTAWTPGGFTSPSLDTFTFDTSTPALGVDMDLPTFGASGGLGNLGLNFDGPTFSSTFG